VRCTRATPGSRGRPSRLLALEAPRERQAALNLEREEPACRRGVGLVAGSDWAGISGNLPPRQGSRSPRPTLLTACQTRPQRFEGAGEGSGRLPRNAAVTTMTARYKLEPAKDARARLGRRCNSAAQARYAIHAPHLSDTTGGGASETPATGARAQPGHTAEKGRGANANRCGRPGTLTPGTAALQQVVEALAHWPRRMR